MLFYDVSGDEGVFLPAVDDERVSEETVISVGDIEDAFDDAGIIISFLCQIDPSRRPVLT